MNPTVTPAPASLYRRPLPDGLISFSSPEGRSLFREALDLGGLERWFPLAEHFHTQSEPAFCALGSLVVVLNALAIDPGRTWKGPWRWYSEELLDCCDPLDRVRERGMTLPTFVCLARCNGATTRLRRPDTAGFDVLREDLAGPGHIVVSFSRASLGQTGEGHYSPIAGWHPGRDLALVLDVARFKYPPFWVPLERLYQATLPADPDTGRPRGWVVLDRDPRPRNLHARIACERPGWRAAAETIPTLLADARVEADPEAAVRRLARTTPAGVRDLIEVQPPARALLEQTRLYGVIRKDLPSDLSDDLPHAAASLALLVLAAPVELLPSSEIFREGVPSALLHEAEALRAQVMALRGS